MLRLRILLVSNYLYILLIIFIIIIYTLLCNYKINYQPIKGPLTGIITNKVINDNIITLTIKNKHNYLIKYYLKDKQQLKSFNNQYQLGTKIKVNGKISIAKSNTNFNSFNYQKYLLSINIKYIVKAEQLTVLKKPFNIYYIKQLFINYLEKLPNPIYLKAMILADQTGINKEVADGYRINGISHLLAISGAQIALFVVILMFLLKRYSLITQFIIITSILLLYGFFTNDPPSINRAIIAYIIVSINKIFDFHISNIKLFILTLFISLIINPYLIHNIGFWYSYVISLMLITYQPHMSKKVIKEAVQISVIAFLASFPISINSFYQVNMLGIIYNLFFVPMVSIIIYPGLLISCILPPLGYLIKYVIIFMESLSSYLSLIDLGIIKSGKLNIIFVISYYLLLIYLINKQRLKYIILYSIIIIYLNSIWLIPPNPVVYLLDVGQGDSIFIENKNNNVLIDNGGKLVFNNQKNNNQSGKTVVSFLNSIGVFKLNYLILTHGDADHMGDSIYLINNLKVNKVIFNCGEFNDLEKSLIKVLNKKNIKYSSCISELNIHKHKLLFLKTREYDNENDNSNVIYTKLNNYKFLFMGDAGIEKEKDILDKYNLKDIDFLKVGHHGSDTSSSKAFIDIINPKYSLVSVGENNKYGHPQESVLNILSSSKIYRTDQDGSIKISLNNNLKLTTCPP